jgi:predicted dehydrogenase
MPARKVTGDKVRYGVVAGGYVSIKFAFTDLHSWISQGAFMPGVEQTGNSVMTALVTGDPTKAEKLAAKYNLKSYSYADFNKLLEDDVVDALYIATPNFGHKEFALPALKAGYHVLLEKPMEIKEEDCKEIWEASKETGAKLMIAYRLHFEPGTLEMIERVRRGDLGEILYFNSIFTQPLKPNNHRAKGDFWTGPIPDVGTYCINAVRNLFALEPIEVRAFGVQTPNNEFEGDFDDIVTVTLLFPGNKIGNFLVSYRGSGTNRFQVIGTEGEIEANPCYMFGSGVKISYRSKIGDKEEDKDFGELDQFSGETHYFSECVLKNEEVECDGEEGWLDVRVEAAIERALKTGQPQKLEHYERKKAPTSKQARKFNLAPQPEKFINADVPAED